MKKFLKKYLWLIIIFFISTTLMLVGTLFSICLIIGAVMMGVFFLCIAFIQKRKYNILKETQDENENIFDATLYDFDEDIYILDNGTPKYKTQIKKGFFSKISALGPTILFSIFGVGLIILSITLFIQMIK